MSGLDAFFSGFAGSLSHSMDQMQQRQYNKQLEDEADARWEKRFNMQTAATAGLHKQDIEERGAEKKDEMTSQQAAAAALQKERLEQQARENEANRQSKSEAQKQHDETLRAIKGMGGSSASHKIVKTDDGRYYDATTGGFLSNNGADIKAPSPRQATVSGDIRKETDAVYKTLDDQAAIDEAQKRGMTFSWDVKKSPDTPTITPAEKRNVARAIAMETLGQSDTAAQPQRAGLASTVADVAGKVGAAVSGGASDKHKGMTLVGYSKGKPVYQDKNGNKFIDE